ncbi:MAG: hypothetical protein ABIK83_13560 [Candidatus Zixiibacteriota bacterium]
MMVTRNIALMVLSVLALAHCSAAQNRIVVVTDSLSGILPPDDLLTELFGQTFNRYEFYDYVPDPLDVHEYSCLILTSRNAAIACTIENIDRFIRSGGGLICGGGIPYYLVTTDSIVPIRDWFDCEGYLNGSGKMFTADGGIDFGLSTGELIDNTPCGLGFGGHQGPGTRTEVLANWTCNGEFSSIAALSARYGAGRATYLSRITSSEPLRQLFVTSIGKSLEYVWGDANNSGEVDIDDVVFLVDYIFSDGSPPEVWNAADPSGDGLLDIDDVISVVGWVFLGEKRLRAGRID